jgi:hypothetical protein
MTRVAVPSSKGKPSARPRPRPRAAAKGGSKWRAGEYLEHSVRPLYSLAFLLPFLVVYEVGTRWVVTDPVHHTQERVIAFNLLLDFFQRLGSTSRYLPAMAVVAILMTWHIARNDSWRLEWRVLGLMALESAAFAAPLFAVSYFLSAHWPLSAGWGRGAVLSVGAGVYEELVFRLIAFTVLHLVLQDWLKIEATRAYLVMVATSAVLFAAYHYLGSETFQWRSFVFRTLAGIYFGVLFLWRGLGVTAGTHTAYDLIIAALTSASA